MKVKPYFTLYLAISLILSISTVLYVFGASTPSVQINNSVVKFSRNPVIYNDRLLVPGLEFIRLIGGDVSKFEPNKSIELNKNSTKLDLYFSRNIAYKNGRRVLLDTVPKQIYGMAMVPIRAVANVFNMSIGWNSYTSTVTIGKKTINKIRNNKETPIIVIDAGHGGKESGAISNGVLEKNINLDIAKRLEQLLNQEGIKTYMTRDTDKYVSLYDRTGLANSVGADLFVSIHNNAGYRKTNGSMVLYHPDYRYDKDFGFSTIDSARVILSEINKQLGTHNLGLIQRPNLAVLRTSKMPAILVEVAYMTNTSELSKLSTSNYRQKAATAIKDGILKTLKIKI
jgi:N-acetylmuramoyl-L-alanine amidase